ncbi:hypothetical protein SKAU_G00353420 [Synaphobranchus kaupii]|uniref:Uncharacterized protein n=1 Tax=Synaphobranchus kaupii TaxID=118154 RepID=A0A9Q1IIF6_SYNKA|nr:hypothetical protein SKAU_G00353420 [Synaphobranchus kaupii]
MTKILSIVSKATLKEIAAWLSASTLLHGSLGVKSLRFLRTEKEKRPPSPQWPDTCQCKAWPFKGKGQNLGPGLGGIPRIRSLLLCSHSSSFLDSRQQSCIMGSELHFQIQNKSDQSRPAV